MQEKSLPIDPDEKPPKEIPRGLNAETLKKFVNDARSARSCHNLALSLEWFNWSMDYLIFAEKENHTVCEAYLKYPKIHPMSPEPRVIFWDLDLGQKIKEEPPEAT